MSESTKEEQRSMSRVLNVSFSTTSETYSMNDINQMLRRAGFIDPRCYAIYFDYEEDKQ